MSAFILAIDQGTTNTKVLLVDGEGRIARRGAAPVPLAYPQAGWVEQDADALWRSVCDAADACLADAGGARATRIAGITGIAIANQRESVVVWERATGRPVGPVVIWQCRRTSARCAQLRLDGMEAVVRGRTGLPIDPLFSASKLAWLLDAIPAGHARAADGALCAGTVDAWLLWNLTGGAAHGGVHRCDASNASRTQLMNLRTLAWDPTLLDLFGVPAPALPEIHPSSGVVGETAACGAIPAGVPVASLIGDSHAALFGQGGFRPGAVKATYGTGSSLMRATPSLVASDDGLCSTVAWGVGGETVYALEGNVSSTGAALQWVAELLGMADPAAAAELAASVPSADGVSFVPAFVGLGAPYWSDRARGLLTGITRGTSAAHLARAALESIAFQVGDVFAAMASDAMASDAMAGDGVLLADGGASRSDALMQLQADVIGRPVVRNNATDISALGAAYLAGLALGTWSSLDEIEALPRALERFEPRMSDVEREAALAAWRGAVARCLYEPDGGRHG